MKRRLLTGGFAAALGLSLLAVPTMAAPANPGCFGQGRAAYATANGSLGTDFGGVGYYASLRAGTNGAENAAYRTNCGGDPTP